MKKRRIVVILFVLGLSLLPVYSFAQTTETKTCFTSNVGLNFADKNSLFSFSGDCKPEMLAQYINALVLYFMRLAIILAVLMLVIGGFQWLLGMGNSEKIGNAKQTIIGAVLGLFLALGSTFIFSQIDKSFTTYDLFTAKTVDEKLTCDQIHEQVLCETNVAKKCVWTCNDPQAPKDPITGGCKGWCSQLGGASYGKTCRNIVNPSECASSVGCRYYEDTKKCDDAIKAACPVKTATARDSAKSANALLCCSRPITSSEPGQQGGGYGMNNNMLYTYASYGLGQGSNCTAICGGISWTGGSSTSVCDLYVTF